MKNRKRRNKQSDEPVKQCLVRVFAEIEGDETPFMKRKSRGASPDDRIVLSLWLRSWVNKKGQRQLFVGNGELQLQTEDCPDGGNGFCKFWRPFTKEELTAYAHAAEVCMEVYFDVHDAGLEEALDTETLHYFIDETGNITEDEEDTRDIREDEAAEDFDPDCLKRRASKKSKSKKKTSKRKGKRSLERS